MPTNAARNLRPEDRRLVEATIARGIVTEMRLSDGIFAVEIKIPQDELFKAIYEQPETHSSEPAVAVQQLKRRIMALEEKKNNA